jgi:hypothetical protein
VLRANAISGIEHGFAARSRSLGGASVRPTDSSWKKALCVRAHGAFASNEFGVAHSRTYLSHEKNWPSAAHRCYAPCDAHSGTSAARTVGLRGPRLHQSSVLPAGIQRSGVAGPSPLGGVATGRGDCAIGSKRPAQFPSPIPTTQNPTQQAAELSGIEPQMENASSSEDEALLALASSCEQCTNEQIPHGESNPGFRAENPTAMVENCGEIGNPPASAAPGAAVTAKDPLIARDLARIVAAWPELPELMRRAMLALIGRG